MRTNEIREPKQQRSIEKKNKIIEAGFKLFCEKGYHNTNTAEIAKEAGVSTGIVYNYFNNKKDILLEAISLYSETISAPMFEEFKAINFPTDISKLLSHLIDNIIREHYIAKSAHEEMIAMSYLDEDVREFFKTYEEKTTNTIVEFLKNIGMNITNPYEKVHIAFNLIEDLCHETIYHNHKNIDYNIMKEQVVSIISNLLIS